MHLIIFLRFYLLNKECDDTKLCFSNKNPYECGQLLDRWFFELFSLEGDPFLFEKQKFYT